MNETRNDKGSVPSVIAAYRKRQERAVRMLVIFWIGIMLLILGAGYLVYRFVIPGKNQALSATETPTITVAPSPGMPATSASAPATAEVLELTEAPAPTEEPAQSRIINYTVKEGDTLVSIANQFGIGLADLIALNPLVTPEFLSVGDQLAVPSQGTGLATVTPASTGSQSILEYKVVSGDTLAAIAARFGSTIDAIVRENNLESPDQIRVGQTLRIPVEAGVATTPAPQATAPADGSTQTPSS